MKTRKEFLLSASTIEYLKKIQDENGLSSLAAALTAIVEDHKHRNDVSATKILVDALAKQVAEELKDTLTRIRLGANNADRNSEVTLLLLNTLLSYSGYKTLIEKETPQLTQARQIMKDRIAHYRQKKLDKSDPKKNTEPELILDEDLLM